jgi:hypothetical protein
MGDGMREKCGDGVLVKSDFRGGVKAQRVLAELSFERVPRSCGWGPQRVAQSHYAVRRPFNTAKKVVFWISSKRGVFFLSHVGLVPLA